MHGWPASERRRTALSGATCARAVLVACATLALLACAILAALRAPQAVAAPPSAPHSAWRALPADTTTPTSPTVAATASGTHSPTSATAGTSVAPGPASTDNSNFIAGLVLIATGALLFLLVSGFAVVLLLRRRAAWSADADAPRLAAPARRSGASGAPSERSLARHAGRRDREELYDGYESADRYEGYGGYGRYGRDEGDQAYPAADASGASGARARGPRGDVPGPRGRDGDDPRDRRGASSGRSRHTSPADWSEGSADYGDPDDAGARDPRRGSSSRHGSGRRPDHSTYPPDEDDPRGYR